ncbi:SLC13 family permease, partial [Alcaligenes pakistanensis]
WHKNATVLGIHRRAQVLREQLRAVRLQVGDILLVLTPASEAADLRADSNIIVLSEREAEKEMGWRAP